MSMIQSGRFGGGGYSPIFVDSNKTAYVMDGQSNEFSDSQVMTFCTLIQRNELGASTAAFMEIASRSTIQINNADKIRVQIKDSTNVLVYDATSTSVAMGATATNYHFFVQIDLSAVTAVIKINGSDVAMTDTVSIVAGTGLIDMSTVSGVGFLAKAGGSTPTDVNVADLWFGHSTSAAKPAFASFYSGAPLDISGVTGADTFIGNRASAATWNAAVNGGSATFT